MDNDGDGQNSEGIQFQPNKTEIFLVILVKDSLSLSPLFNCSLSTVYFVFSFFIPNRTGKAFSFLNYFDRWMGIIIHLSLSVSL